MATIYRDYGSIGADNGAAPIPFTITPRRQTYLATHNGDNRLDFMNRSFISFSYGGKNIEDFDLIACTNGDSLNRAGYAPFTDITSSYDILNGLLFWSTHYQANTLDLDLVSDGIDLRKLDDFLYWFRAGEAKELILAEHPNRAILARVATPPQLELLPFEEKIEVPISQYTYNTSTTLYKGHILLSFVMDEPHWYSIRNILGIKEDNHYINWWYDANGNKIEIFASKDALKILYEDGIPLGSMIQKNMLLGNGGYANVESNIMSNIWGPSEYALDASIVWEDGVPSGLGARIDGAITAADKVENPNIKSAPGEYYGVIAGAVVDATGNGITKLKPRGTGSGEYGYFYYSGTAPAPTIIRFTFTPKMDANGYIKTPSNTKSTNSLYSGGARPYDTIYIESTNILELRITTPNIFTSYNKAVEWIQKYTTEGKTIEELRKKLREEVRHIRVREMVNMWLNDFAANITMNSTRQSYLLIHMKDMFGAVNELGVWEMKDVTFTFNSDTGKATGDFEYQVMTSDGYTGFLKFEEDIGDCLLSNYIVIKDRNYAASNGAIEGWTAVHPEYSHRIYHNMSVPIRNFSILYKNMYL